MSLVWLVWFTAVKWSELLLATCDNVKKATERAAERCAPTLLYILSSGCRRLEACCRTRCPVGCNKKDTQSCYESGAEIKHFRAKKKEGRPFRGELQTRGHQTDVFVARWLFLSRLRLKSNGIVAWKGAFCSLAFFREKKILKLTWGLFVSWVQHRLLFRISNSLLNPEGWVHASAVSQHWRWSLTLMDFWYERKIFVRFTGIWSLMSLLPSKLWWELAEPQEKTYFLVYLMFLNHWLLLLPHCISNIILTIYILCKHAAWKLNAERFLRESKKDEHKFSNLL